MNAGAARDERGFSLVELLVAMLVTLIVTGAIYGLLASGQTAFRREPELADRQQNIRVAMDLISRDVLNAGAGLPAAGQVFTISDPGALSGLNGLGPLGSLGTAAAAARNSDPSTNSDVLEILSAEERCPAMTVCPPVAQSPGTAGTFFTNERVPACMTSMAILTDNTNFTVQPVSSFASPSTTALCNLAVAPADNGSFTLAAAPSPWNAPPSFTTTTFLYAGNLVRYRIAPSNDPSDPPDPVTGLRTPSLWRSPSGRFSTTGALVAEPGAGGPGANSNWQLVARGIEDLQVEYLDGSGTWRNSPRAVPVPPAATDPTTIVRNVRVTIAARTIAPNLLGATSAGAGPSVPPAIRGSLVSVITPRAAIVNLQILNTQQ